MHFQIPKQQWTKIEETLKDMPQEETQGLQKSDYLDLAEQLLEHSEEPKADSLDACAHWVWIGAVLLSNGRKGELQTRFCERMTHVCNMMDTSLSTLSVTEVLLALSLMKEYDTNGDWAKMLSSVEEKQEEGIVFDENGMVVSGSSDSLSEEIARRFCLQLMEYRGKISFSEELRRGGVWSLMTQSATGRLLYGGEERPLYQQALLVSVLEYEAGKQAEVGDFVLAGRMRRGARLAAEAFREEMSSMRAEGEETLLAASALCGGVLFAREDLSEHPAPCEAGGYVLSLSPKFHQIFARGCGYSLQIDTKGEPFGATGLGRIHKKGIPAFLGLSAPFSRNFLEDGKSLSCAIGIGWDDGEGGIQFLSDTEGIKHALSVEEEKQDKLRFTVTYTGNSLKNCGGVMETYSLDEGGLRYSAKLLESECKAVYARVPLFVKNGFAESTIKQKAGQTNVYLGSCRWRITTNASLLPDEIMAENQNGVYKIATLVRLEPKIRLNLSLCQENESE